MKIINIGDKFNKLTFMGGISHNMFGNKTGEFECECGIRQYVEISKVINGKTKSCGCFGNNIFKTTHGLCYSSFYKKFKGIKDRCNNKNIRDYHRYGGRGIKCERKSFEEFRDDMYSSYLKHVEEYGEKNTSLDRINNDGNYSKENCKRSTPIEQANNTAKNRIITYNGQEYTIATLCRKFNLPYHTALWRINKGRSIYDVINKPTQKH